MRIFFNELLRKLFGEYNYADITSWISYKMKLGPSYNDTNTVKRSPRCIYYMADGKMIHGGIGDRIYGMVALYSYCNLEHVKFNIYHISPFSWCDYLEPNKYDWRDNLSNLCYNSNTSKAVYVKNTRNDNFYYLNKKLSFLSAYNQIHAYTNIHVIGDDFAVLFDELFKPTDVLKKEISRNLESIKGNYISVTFRFQQLLGDFKEGNYCVLDEKKKKKLIEKCLNFIIVVKDNNPEVDKILITSDSHSFLDLVKEKYNFVYVISGVVNHVDYTNNQEHLAYLKSFVDLFMISQAQKIYSYCTGPMYKDSGFAKLASLIGEKPYLKIEE